MQANLRRLGESGEAFVNGWATIPSAFASELLAMAGFDGVTVDMQHGLADLGAMTACLQAIQLHGLAPTVRVPWNEPGVIGRALDAGARGVICPMVNSRAEAEQFVSACLYPPIGARSFGPSRARFFEPVGPEFTRNANAQILCMPMIETQRAVDNLDEILAVEGVGGVYIGPSDLGVSLGLGPGMDRQEAEILAVMRDVVTRTRARKQVAGLACGSGAFAARAIDMGFQFVSISSDGNLLLVAAQQCVTEARARTDRLAG